MEVGEGGGVFQLLCPSVGPIPAAEEGEGGLGNPEELAAEQGKRTADFEGEESGRGEAPLVELFGCGLGIKIGHRRLAYQNLRELSECESFGAILIYIMSSIACLHRSVNLSTLMVALALGVGNR
jgi:hypothetical protein